MFVLTASNKKGRFGKESAFLNHQTGIIPKLYGLPA